MKKIFLFSLLLTLMLAGCSGRSNFKTIKAAEAITRLDNQESIVLVIGISTCAACKEYRPIVEELVKNYSFEVFYVELDSDVNTDVQQLIEKHLIEARWTPTTYIFNDGKLVESKTGSIRYQTLRDWLMSYEIIE